MRGAFNALATGADVPYLDAVLMPANDSITEPGPGSRPLSTPRVREPAPSELPRALHLFRHLRLREGSRLLVAEKTHPVPRFVAAAAWWAEGVAGRFQLALQPGAAQTDALAALLEAVVAATREFGLQTVQYAELIPDGAPWVNVLQAQGFERVRSERSFEIAYRDAWMRTMRLYERHRAAIPSTWRSDPIRNHKPEEILELAAPHRLLPPDELRYYWQGPTRAGFDLDMSCILFDGQRPFGTFLARHPGDVLYIDVQVVQEPNPRLRSLGDLCLLYHGASRVPPSASVTWLRFRSGESEHRQTANLAIRMGGRELGRMHMFARTLRS